MIHNQYQMMNRSSLIGISNRSKSNSQPFCFDNFPLLRININLSLMSIFIDEINYGFIDWLHLEFLMWGWQRKHNVRPFLQKINKLHVSHIPLITFSKSVFHKFVSICLNLISCIVLISLPSAQLSHMNPLLPSLVDQNKSVESYLS